MLLNKFIRIDNYEQTIELVNCEAVSFFLIIFRVCSSCGINETCALVFQYVQSTFWGKMNEYNASDGILVKTSERRLFVLRYC